VRARGVKATLTKREREAAVRPLSSGLPNFPAGARVMAQTLTLFTKPG
jgi:hypothetical protein